MRQGVEIRQLMEHVMYQERERDDGFCCKKLQTLTRYWGLFFSVQKNAAYFWP